MTIPVLFPKIETLWDRDKATFRVIDGAWRLPEFALVRPEAWIFQEKIDGTNIRIGWDGQSVEFGGRGDNANIPGDLVAGLVKHFTAERMAAVFPALEGHAILFGEGYGPGIQKGGGDYRADKGFILFDVRVGEWWLEVDQVADVAAKLDIPAVPTYPDSIDAIVSALERGALMSATGLKARLAEGIVARTNPTLKRRDGSRIMWKLKHSDFREGKR